MPELIDLLELFRHNTWANLKVFHLAAQQPAAAVEAAAPGTRDTVLGTLAHLASVEYAYLRMLQRRPFASIEEVQRWAAHELSWFPEQMGQIGQDFRHLLETSTPEQLDQSLGVPWFPFEVTAREGLRQVLSHSAQHRSQVLSWLSAQGVATPDLDYVLMLREERAPSTAEA